jgi:hypothetical protein
MIPSASNVPSAEANTFTRIKLLIISLSGISGAIPAAHAVGQSFEAF